ncbi:hypothetical protein GCM10010441_72280 [Kitasatospora paracochleata]
MADVTTSSGDGTQPGPDLVKTVPLPGPGDRAGAERTGEPPVPADPFELPPPAATAAAPVVPPMPAMPPTAPAGPGAVLSAAPPAAGPGGASGVPSTGWTSVMPAITLPPGGQPSAEPVPPRGIGNGLRGRILVVEGGYAGGRRPWARGGSAHTHVLSEMMAGVAPQVLLSADAVDAVHLPGGADPQTVLAHLRAAARHPGPVLVHLGGHLVVDRRGGQLYLSLRDAKPSESLPWSALAAELRHRPAELDTLVIADLSADHAMWPQLQAMGPGLAEGVPMWAVVTPDPDQLGTFTRALIEALHRGRPGAEALLAPEQLQPQVHSVLRPDSMVVVAHPADRPYFRNTSRQIGGGPDAAHPEPPQAARPTRPAPVPAPSAAEPRVELGKGRISPTWTPRGMVSLRKPGVPPTPARPPRPVSLLKGRPAQPDAAATVDLAKPADGGGAERVDLAKPSAAVDPDLAATLDLADRDSAPAATLDLADPDSALAATLDLAEHGAGPAARVELGKRDGGAPSEPAEAATVDLAERDSALAATLDLADRDSALAATLDLADHDGALAATVDLAKPDGALAATVDLGKPAPAPEAETATAAAEEPPTDYREAIGRIVRCADAGEHDTAAELALALEEQAVAAHGPAAPSALQARQVRAHVSRLAGRPALAAELYREVALTLLRTEGAGHPETQQAATNAEACWRAIPDPAEAIRIAPDIIELRAHLPGPDGRKLRAAERYLMQLAEAKAKA